MYLARPGRNEELPNGKDGLRGPQMAGPYAFSGYPNPNRHVSNTGLICHPATSRPEGPRGAWPSCGANGSRQINSGSPERGEPMPPSACAEALNQRTRCALHEHRHRLSRRKPVPNHRIDRLKDRHRNPEPLR